MGYGGTHLPEMFFWWTLGCVVAASALILLVWGASALATWGIDKLWTRKEAVEPEFGRELPPLWPGMADIPLDEPADRLRQRWASTGKLDIFS